MESINNLSKNLKVYQNKLGMTQNEFASYLNIPRSTIQSVMAKNGNTTVDTLIRISASLPFSLDVLVLGDLSTDETIEEICAVRSSACVVSSVAVEQRTVRSFLCKLLRFER